MKIGQRLKKLRALKGLTLEEAGKKVGITKQTLYKYEMGIVTNIPSDRIEALALLYDTTPSHIMGWGDNVLYGNDVPQELRDLGVEWIEFSKKAKSLGFTPEQLTEFIETIQKLKS